jgi:hypothetical protein
MREAVTQRVWCPSRWWAATGLCPNPSRPASVWLTPPTHGGLGRAGDCIFVTLSSSGWRRTSRTWRRNSGSSSRKSMLWCGRDTVAGHRHVAPADQPRIRDGMMGGATRAGRDQRRAVARQAGDAVDTRGLDRFGQGHRRQDGGKAPCQHRLARPRRAEQEEIIDRTPASRSPSYPQVAVMSTPQDDMAVITHAHAAGAAMLLDNLQGWSSAQDSSSSKPLASWRSAVSKPSVNQPQTGASSSRAPCRLPYCCHSRLRLVAARSSQDLA